MPRRIGAAQVHTGRGPRLRRTGCVGAAASPTIGPNPAVCVELVCFSMSVNRSLITSTSNPLLEQALRRKLQRRGEVTGGLGELEPLAVRLGPDPEHAQAALSLAADRHLRGRPRPGGRRHRRQRPPLDRAARQPVVDVAVAGVGVRPHPGPGAVGRRLRRGRIGDAACPPAGPQDRARHAQLARRVRRCRSTRPTPPFAPAWKSPTRWSATRSPVPASASARTRVRRWCCRACRACDLRDLLTSGAGMRGRRPRHLLAVLQAAHARHKDAVDPVEVLAAFGGFEIAMMVGLMLVAGSKRHLIVVDGMPACAALMVATRIAPAVTDYCVYCRSHSHKGLDAAHWRCSASRPCSNSASKAPTAPAPRWPGRWCAARPRC